MPDTTDWIPVVNSAIVGASTILGIIVTQIWSSRRDRRAKDLDAVTQRQNQRTDFQRKTLLQLQLAVQHQARAVGAANHQDNMAFKETGRWGHLLDDDINQNLFNSSVKVKLLTARVLNDEIRSMIDQLNELESPVLLSRSHDEASAAMLRWVNQLDQLNKVLGKHLRSLL